MNLYGCYYQEDKNHYELVFIGEKKEFINFNNLTMYEAFAMDKKTCDYDREAFVVVIKNSCTLKFTKKVVLDKNFLYTQLLKINRNINIKIREKEIKVKVK